MKPEEAIERIKYDMAMMTFNPMTGEDTPLWLLSGDERQSYEAWESAIEALKEVQQYREIGTVEECREAVEKQKPKRCNVTKDNFQIFYYCPQCNHNIRTEYNRGSWLGKKSKYCSDCGQAIQWNYLEGMEDERN